MKEVRLEVPSWVGEMEAKKEFVHFLLNEALMKVEYYRSLMKPFERKYAKTYSDFKKHIELSQQESFEEWDDLIEWEAYYRAHEEWVKKYEELKDVWSNYRNS